jgi:hypothetical protein
VILARVFAFRGHEITLFWALSGATPESAMRHKRMWVSLAAAAKKQNAPPRMIGRGVLFIAEQP